MGNASNTKKKLANSIQKQMNKIDRLLRVVANSNSQKKVNDKLREAEKVYGVLGKNMKSHKQTYGDFPEWVNITWHGMEKYNGDGKVWKVMQGFKGVEKEKDMKRMQDKLWNAIRLPNEKRRGNLTQKEMENEMSKAMKFHKYQSEISGEKFHKGNVRVI